MASQKQENESAAAFVELLRSLPPNPADQGSAALEQVKLLALVGFPGDCSSQFIAAKGRGDHASTDHEADISIRMQTVWMG